jgi:hypothetical protein
VIVGWSTLGRADWAHEGSRPYSDQVPGCYLIRTQFLRGVAGDHATAGLSLMGSVNEGSSCGRPAHDHGRSRQLQTAYTPLFACNDCTFIDHFIETASRKNDRYQAPAFVITARPDLLVSLLRSATQLVLKHTTVQQGENVMTDRNRASAFVGVLLLALGSTAAAQSPEGWFLGCKAFAEGRPNRQPTDRGNMRTQGLVSAVAETAAGRGRIAYQVAQTAGLRAIEHLPVAETQ